jgi:hypothetical protein
LTIKENIDLLYLKESSGEKIEMLKQDSNRRKKLHNGELHSLFTSPKTNVTVLNKSRPSKGTRLI